jgi:hypothetical protein
MASEHHSWRARATRITDLLTGPAAQQVLVG